MIDDSAKGPCSPKTGHKVVFRVGEKGFSKNPFLKGISDPKTGLKRAKGLSGPTLRLRLFLGGCIQYPQDHCLSMPINAGSRHQ